MNPLDNAGEARRKPLSLKQARTIVLAMAGFILLLVAFGIHALLVRQKFFGGICCLLAFVWLLTLSIYVHLYRQVKEGKEVILRPLSVSQSPRVPFWVSIVFTSLLTLLVAAASVTSFSGFMSFRSSALKLIILGLNLFFWLVTAFVWYCALATERGRKEIEPVWEQTEGVWPPAPKLGNRSADNGERNSPDADADRLVP